MGNERSQGKERAEFHVGRKKLSSFSPNPGNPRVSAPASLDTRGRASPFPPEKLWRSLGAPLPPNPPFPFGCLQVLSDFVLSQNHIS